MAIEGNDLQALMSMIREEHIISRRELLDTMGSMISAHEETELKGIKSAIREELTDTHDEEHAFIKQWMTRMDSMGEGFFGSVGKGLATLIFLGFAALALASLGK